jgi:hypothetical protein
MLNRISALLVALLAAMLMAPPAGAQRLRLVYIPPANPIFPSTQTINFGAKTLVGQGGSPMGYKNPGLLGFARWLAITNVQDKNSTSICSDVTACAANSVLFKIDGRNMLVPQNGATAYGGAWSNPANGPYTVTVGEYLDPLHTTPTGRLTVITVPIIPNAAHAREMTSAARGCLVNCETAQPDGGAGSLQSETNQFNALVKTGGPICLGDTIYARDAGNGAVSPTKFNPTQVRYDIRPKALAAFSTGACAGATGRVTITSETTDASTDGYGLPALQHGFRFGGGIEFNINDIGAATSIPIDVSNVYCYEDFNQTSGSPNACFTYNSTSATGGGVGLYSSRCEITAAVVAEQFCFNSYGSATVNYNRFIYTGITVRAQQGTLIAVGNVGQNLREDMFSIGCSPDSVITDNFMFDPSPKAGVHQDFEQSVGCATPWNFGTVARNILVLNNIAALAGVADAPQFIFNANQTASPYLQATASGANILNNFGYSLAQNMIDYSYWSGATINFNGGLTMANPIGTPLTPNPGKILLQPGQGVCCDVTANNNAANGGSFAGQPGTIIDANRVTIPWTGVGATDLARYKAAFPNLNNASPANLGITTRAEAIRQFTPAYRTGDLYNLDGSYSWPWTPADSAGRPCWNNGLTTFDNTKTCAAQGLQPAT